MYMHSKAPFNSASAFLQPSRAWSKNGLFMFLGTSAKTNFASAADTAMVSAPKAMTVLISSFFIGSFLLVDLHWYCRQ